MPYVNIKVAKTGVQGGFTAGQKAQVISGVTKVLEDALGKNPKLTYVVIEEIELENWGSGGESVAQRIEREGK